MLANRSVLDIFFISEMAHNSTFHTRGIKLYIPYLINFIHVFLFVDASIWSSFVGSGA